MNRILRPGGYFVLSQKHNNIEEEEGFAWSNFNLFLLLIEERQLFFVLKQ